DLVVGDLEQRQADVDGVAEEDARERPSKHDRDARGGDGEGRLLAAGAAAEVLAGHQHVALPQAGDELRVVVLQQVDSQLRGVERLRVLAGDDAVGVYVVAHHVRGAGVGVPWCGPGVARCHAAPPAVTGPSTSAGSTMCPATAAAAT